MRHTLGPWYGKATGSADQGLIISEATGANIAVAYDHRDTALIAAAPEMLKVLQRISSRIADCPHIVTTDPDFYEWQDALGFIRIWADQAIYNATGGE